MGTQVDLFSVPPSQTSIEWGQWVEHHPISSISQNGPIEFMVAGSSDEYLDLSETLLYVKASVKRVDGERKEATEFVTPVNNFLHSLFSQVDVMLNDTVVSASSATYPYRAIIETLLSYGQDSQRGKLTAQCFYKDTAGHMNEAHGRNTGAVSRGDLVRGDGKEVDMIGCVHSDIFYQNRYLLTGVNVKLRFLRSSPEFCLTTGVETKFKVNISNATLYVRKVRLAANVALAHEKRLLSSTAKYPVTRVECKVMSIPQGNSDYVHENLFLGQLPKRMVLSMVRTRAFNGDAHKNPFNFEHMDVKNISVHLDGRQIPWAPLTPDIANDLTVRSYYTQFTAGSSVISDGGQRLRRDEFAKGYAFFCFDLTPDLSSGCGTHINLVKQGTLRLKLEFANALPEPVSVIAYSEFDNLIEINKDREVIHDYKS